MTAIDQTLRAVNLTRVYPPSAGNPAVPALGPLDIEIREGEFFSIVGPSGCGKSTFLDLVAGLSRATSGQIFLGNRKIDGTPPAEVGVVFQEDTSFPWLTVRDNVAFGLRRHGVAAAEVTRRVEDALNLVGLSKFQNAYPAQLSGGMRQRVCIARTLVLNPKLILLDEPFGALDQQTRLLMGDELLRIWRDTKATILLITHALDEAALLSDRIGVMSARPGRFLDIVETNWPCDRDSRIVASERFGQITSKLWALLRDESLKSNRH